MDIPCLRPIPRCRLAQTPTPVVKTAFGWGNKPLYVKRDDLTGSALSGNKVRKLEYLIADARRVGANTLLTCGSVQSNCARALAMTAASTGFESTLILTGEKPPVSEGNFLLDCLAGSEVRFVPAGDAEARDTALWAAAEDVRRRGRVPYVVPFGGSSEVGVLGYVRAGFELVQQLGAAAREISHVVVPMASGGTLAGLYIGFQLAGAAMKPVGAFVEGVAGGWRHTLEALIASSAKRWDLPIRIRQADMGLIDARGQGYGQPTDEELDFIVSFIRQTGLLVDPVYTGKALWALDRDIRSGALEPKGEVLFLHTGGAFGLFPYAAELTARLNIAAGKANRSDLAPADPSLLAHPTRFPQSVLRD